MDSTLQGVYLNIPKADMKLFKALARKMGWKMTIQTEKESVKRVDAKRDVINELHGSVQLPEGFDYKTELRQAIYEKYL